MWDVFAVNTYFIVSVLFWYMGLIPDLAVLRDRAKTQARKFFYGLFALGWTGSARQWHNYEKAYLDPGRPLPRCWCSRCSSIVGTGLLPRRNSPAGTRRFSRSISWRRGLFGFGMVLVLLIPLRKLLPPGGHHHHAAH